MNNFPLTEEGLHVLPSPSPTLTTPPPAMMNNLLEKGNQIISSKRYRKDNLLVNILSTKFLSFTKIFT